MCLFANNLKPFVAKKDIAVVKVLYGDNGKFMTPVYWQEVTLNEELKPSGRFRDFLNDTVTGNQVRRGVIHSYLTERASLTDKERQVKAIIKKGTRFYVSINCKEIASESLFITDEDITSDEINETKEYILSEIKSNSQIVDGIRVGDIYLSNKTFVHIEDYEFSKSNSTPVGVVGWINDNTLYIISLKELYCPWNEKTIATAVNGRGPCNLYSDTDGITNTSNLREHYEQCIKDFPSLEYCINYVTEGTKKGDWHMASPYEIRHILMNKVLINMSIGKINGELIADDGAYWTSAEGRRNFVWAGLSDNGQLIDLFSIIANGYARPCLAIQLKEV